MTNSDENMFLPILTVKTHGQSGYRTCFLLRMSSMTRSRLNTFAYR